MKFKNDIWGRYGYPSYEDNSVSEEIKLEVIKKKGYISSDLFEFDSWTGIMGEEKTGEDYDDIAPGCIQLIYNPVAINSKPLRIQLYTEWKAINGIDRPGCEIPAIPAVTESVWIPYPSEKNDRTWQEFYNLLIEKFNQIELVLTAKEWFFQSDNFDKFTRPKSSLQRREGDPKWWTFKGEPVDFERIHFGWSGSYWGTLWYFLPRI